MMLGVFYIDGAMLSALAVVIYIGITGYRLFREKDAYLVNMVDWIAIFIILGLFIDSFPLHRYAFGYTSEGYITTLIIGCLYLGLRANFKFIWDKKFNINMIRRKHGK